MSIRRRAVLAGLAGTLITARGALSAPTGDPEVVILGAGAAGIAAARTLHLLGRRVQILEARNRVGGRAVTESTALGATFDVGPAWLHNSTINPLVRIARDNGIALTESDRENGWLYETGVRADASDVDAYQNAESRLYTTAALITLGGLFDAPLSAAAGNDPWKRLIARQLTAGDIGADPTDISIQDLLSLSDRGTDVIPAGGVGTLIASLAQGLPIRFDAPVTHLQWGGANGVTAIGGFGAVDARVALVTLPTNLIVDGSLTFAPALPTDVAADFANLPLGLLMKIAFRLSALPAGYPEFAVGLREIRVAHAHVVHLRPTDRIVTVLTGGSLARELSSQGQAGVLGFGRDILVDIFGANVLNLIERSTWTAWDRDPYSKGAYSVARPGHADAREVYGRSLGGGQVVFAGEGGGGELAMTIGGAWRSGVAAAQRIHRSLR